MNNRSPVEARVNQHFDASPECVFDAWLDTALVRQWFAPGMGEMVRVEIEAREGGTFSFVQRRGDEDIDHIGRYLEIDRPHRLAFTWTAYELGDETDKPASHPQEGSPDYSRVTIDITSDESGSDVTLTHEMHPDWADFKSGAENAWTMMLDSIDKTLRQQRK